MFPLIETSKTKPFSLSRFFTVRLLCSFSSQPIYLVKIQLQLYKLHNSCYILQYIPIIYTVIFQAVGGSATVPSKTIGTARQIHLFMLYTKDIRVFFCLFVFIKSWMWNESLGIQLLFPGVYIYMCLNSIKQKLLYQTTHFFISAKV